MCRFPGIWNSLIDISITIQGPGCKLPFRIRKLAILRTAWLCQAPYEFGEHVSQARRMGFSADEIEQIVKGSDSPQWNTDEQTVLRAVEELHSNAMISDEIWEKLADRLDEHQLVELIVLIGQFTATAYFQNAFKLRLESGNEGLLAR